MVATYTLATTGFANPVLASDSIICFMSTSGLVPGVFVFANRELMRIVGPTVAQCYTVLRGQDGTETRAHSPLETVYIAQGFQLFSTDPTGVPPVGVRSNPHINVQNGNVWVIQGDEVGSGTQDRSWQLVTTVQSIGALGVRQYTVTTPT